MSGAEDSLLLNLPPLPFTLTIHKNIRERGEGEEKIRGTKRKVKHQQLLL
jgi:hypothetical protein